MALLIDEFLTRKSVPPLVVTHARAVELYSLFCTTYLPPATDLVCSPHKVVAPVCVLITTIAATAPEAATIAPAAAASDRLIRMKSPILRSCGPAPPQSQCAATRPSRRTSAKEATRPVNPVGYRRHTLNAA